MKVKIGGVSKSEVVFVLKSFLNDLLKSMNTLQIFMAVSDGYQKMFWYLISVTESVKVYTGILWFL